MFRIIRTANLRALQADAAATAEARQEVVAQAADVEVWHSRYDETRAAYDRVFKELGQAHADRIQAERDRADVLIRQELDQAATEQEMGQIRDEYRRIRDAAADPETGESVRAAIALRFLGDLYVDARERGQDTSALDMVAVVCGFATTPQPETAPTA
ncbi:hypothetical protein [Streptomyces prasinus]|uniref:hypothetical protein n=1 Tax=Streptomyces prasinus TaxID=67345 RepID=UPI0033B5B3B3